MKLFLNSFLPKPEAEADGKEVNRGMKSTPNDSAYTLIEEADLTGMLKPREDFSHKGTYGHALILAGRENTMGAALLAAQACVYAGAGLTTACIPKSGLGALNTLMPEVMYLSRRSLGKDLYQNYTAIAVGPGLGQGGKQQKILERLIHSGKAIVADADALNILSARQDILQNLPANSILTPHMKEFDRLFGSHEHWFSRLETAVAVAETYQCIIVLKNQYTFTVSPQGRIFINPTGNPAMAQGGMGDVLSGVITAYISQGYQPLEAVLISCFIHGKASDELAKSFFSITASQVARQIPKTVRSLID